MFSSPGAYRQAYVWAGLVPAIHVFSPQQQKAWMPGTRPGMTT
jgi:hypothetical protein